MASLASQRLRILCIHGFTSSAPRMRKQVGDLVNVLEPYAELVFVNGPQDAYGGHAWWNADTAGGTTVYRGFEKTKTYLSTIAREQGPFDGVMGFSQGAILTSVLCGLRDSLFPFSFAIMVGGFAARDQAVAKAYDQKQMYSLPSLHVYGTADDIVAPEGSKALAEMFENPKTIVHEHIIPWRGIEDEWAEFIKEQRAPSSRY